MWPFTRRKKNTQTIKEKTRVTSDDVTRFIASLGNIGNPENKVLDPRYALNSRVPCTDLIPFISARILANDKASIKTIMNKVVEGNPFSMSSFTDTAIDEILEINFSNFVTFESAKAIAELQALFIVVSKQGGGGRQFLVSDKTLQYFSWVLIAYTPNWSQSSIDLIDKAKAWVNEKVKDTPYWLNYDANKFTCIPVSIINAQLSKKIIALSPAARMHLFFTIKKGGGKLEDLTDFSLRSFGINVHQTSAELINSGLVTSSFSPDAITSVFTQNELVQHCSNYGVEYRKSWAKPKLINAISKFDPLLLIKICEKEKIVFPDFDTYPELKKILDIADEHTKYLELLCFI